MHTHYDGQVTWDPLLTPSIWHGVTTVVMGNCGVGFAPAAPDRHDWLIGLMEGVEGIPGASLREAIKWDWESVGEYLDALDRIPRAIDVAAQVPHGAVRAFVMGERGAANEPATDDDIARMAELVAEGVAAGAVGVSVNRLELHKAVDGREVPGTFASIEEISALVRAARQGLTRRGVHHDPAAARRRPTAPRGTARSTGSARLSRETGLVVTFPFGGGTDGDVARQARPHRSARTRTARASSRRSARTVRACSAGCARRTRSGPPHVRGDRAPARRRARARAWPSPT